MCYISIQAKFPYSTSSSIFVASPHCFVKKHQEKNQLAFTYETCPDDAALHHRRPVAAARGWNSLPPFVTNARSLPVFWQRQKTELFRHSLAQKTLFCSF